MTTDLLLVGRMMEWKEGVSCCPVIQALTGLKGCTYSQMIPSNNNEAGSTKNYNY